MSSPTSSYIVCATPRSGSRYLGELLSATGVAGRPQEFFADLHATGRPRQPREYFAINASPQVLDLLPETQPGIPESTEAFEQRLTDALRDGTTANGVWGLELMWASLLDFLRRLKERESTVGLHSRQAIEQIAPGTEYVHIQRRDKLAQAISLWSDIQPEAPEYSHRGIAHLREQLTNQERAWTRWFQASDIEPHVVVYEELVDRPEGTATALLRDLHIDTFGAQPASRGRPNRPHPDWAERFESELRAAA